MKKTLITTIVGAALTCAASAQITVAWTQVGSDVIAHYTGTINTTYSTNFVDANNMTNTISAYPTEFHALSGVIPRDYVYGFTGTTFMDSPGLGGAQFQTGDILSIEGQYSAMTFDGNLGSTNLGSYTVNGSLRWTGKDLANYNIRSGDVGGFGAGADERVLFTVAPVPEPSSTALLGLGALGLLVRRKR